MLFNNMLLQTWDEPFEEKRGIVIESPPIVVKHVELEPRMSVLFRNSCVHNYLSCYFLEYNILSYILLTFRPICCYLHYKKLQFGMHSMDNSVKLALKSYCSSAQILQLMIFKNQLCYSTYYSKWIFIFKTGPCTHILMTLKFGTPQVLNWAVLRQLNILHNYQHPILTSVWNETSIIQCNGHNRTWSTVKMTYSPDEGGHFLLHVYA